MKTSWNKNSAGTIGQMQEMNEPADVTIDEIKGVYRKLADIEVPETVHVAQAMCYAYIYAKRAVFGSDQCTDHICESGK